jgi:hypothetical protein
MQIYQATSGIHLARFAAQCRECRVVETSGLFQVIAANHDVGEHVLSPVNGPAGVV